MSAPPQSTERPADAVADGPDTSQGLGGHTARGVAWVAGARLGSQLLQFASTIVLARLLVPSDYGLIAIVWTFTSFAFLLSDLGLGASLVQRDRLAPEDAATAFWINAVAGVVLTLLVVALSGALAQLFGEPRLGPLLALAGVGYAIAMTVVPIAILERQLRFRAIALIDIGSFTLGTVISIACAAAGVGAASLVIGPLVTTGVTTVSAFAISRWLPRARPTRAAARRLVGFGGHLTGFNILNFWARNADNLLLGKVGGPTVLGLYNRAYMLMLMPINQVGGVLGRVLLPVFSRLAGDRARLGSAFLRVGRTGGIITFPLLFGLAAVAANFVPVAFGERWTGMVPLLVVLALSGPPQIVGVLSGVLCQATGQPRLLSTWGNLTNVTVVLAILIGLPWKAEGVAVAFAVNAYLVLPIVLVPVRRTLGLGLRDVARANALPFLAAGAMGLAVAGLGRLLDAVTAPAVVLVVQVAAGAAIYLGLLRAADPRALTEVVALLRRRAVPA
ncbi:MAG: hypothetical protein QOE86_1317 [Solirubrobacteraceae bacterium]|nr:hypothetical protein [Solirubrobacteraceae bacterium]